jgi:hypothetical protein
VQQFAVKEERRGEKRKGRKEKGRNKAKAEK